MQSVKLSDEKIPAVANTVTKPSYRKQDLSPGIVHVGVGNFHRAHQAHYLDRLFESGVDKDWAIVGAGVTQYDVQMRERLQSQDWLTTVVELDPEQLSARITSSMIDFIDVDSKTHHR